jgi:hypothetical protein
VISFPEPDTRRVTPSKLSRPFAVAALLVVGVVLGIALMSVAGHVALRTGSGLLHRLVAMLTGRTTSVDVSSAAVVEKIRKLNRLETVVYSIDKIVVGRRENILFPNFLAGDKLLLIAHGEVIAGIDLSLLQPGDVSVSGDRVSIRMPNPIVLSTRIDNQRSRVYSRDTGLLVAADPNLESEVRQAAEEQIGQAAISDGILDKARTNAQASLTMLLYGLGFHNVEIH